MADTFRFTCSVCPSSTWDVMLSAEKRASLKAHKTYIQTGGSGKTNRSGALPCAEDTDFKCPSCGEVEKLTCIVV